MGVTAKKTILVTGGAGFIGSHICVELITNGYDVVILDNFVNSKEDVIQRLEKITSESITFYKADIRDREMLEKIFNKHTIDTVIHCAGLKIISESIKDPTLYYDNNVCGSVVLLQTMTKFNVKKIVFSSSACVYGTETPAPHAETASVKPANPYGRTKLIIEEILYDIVVSDSEWSVVLLRYFNPIGAHPSGLIGGDYSGELSNLMSCICKVAQGILPEVLVFGGDYETLDGTGIRDYIHVVDLASGHLKALNFLDSNNGILTVNLGTGKGVSVLDLIKAFKKASGRNISYRIVSRRASDIAISYADPRRAEKELGWKASLSIDDACKDEWRWLSQTQVSNKF